MPPSSENGDGHDKDNSRWIEKNSNTDDIDRSKVESTTLQLPIEPSSLLNIEIADWLIPHVRIRLTHGGSNYNYSSRNVLSWTYLKDVSINTHYKIVLCSHV